MIQLLFNPAALLFTLTTTFGVLVHDTQLDRATTVALAAPAAIAGFIAVDAMNKSDQSHTHVERASAHHNVTALRAMSPRLQPRDDDLRQIQTKKLYFGGGDSTSLWPSI